MVPDNPACRAPPRQVTARSLYAVRLQSLAAPEHLVCRGWLVAGRLPVASLSLAAEPRPGRAARASAHGGLAASDSAAESESESRTVTVVRGLSAQAAVRCRQT